MSWVDDYYMAYLKQRMEWGAALRGPAEALREVWSQDAAAAWQDGRAFYQPILIFRGAATLPCRDKDTEIAMEAIAAAGWQLHTWAIATHAHAMGSVAIVTAHPLFIRPQA